MEKKSNQKNNISMKKIVSFVCATVAAAAIGVLVTKGLPPMYTEVYADHNSSIFCQVNGEEDVLPIFSNMDSITAVFTNGNDGHIKMNSIDVKVHRFEEVEEFIVRDDIGGKGEIGEPIYFMADIGSDPGESPAVLRTGEGFENQQEDAYIVLPPETTDKYVISMNMKEEGIYEVSLEFEYRYHTKEYHISSNKIRFVYREAEKSGDYDKEIMAGEKINIDRQEDFDWWSGYIDILKNVQKHFIAEDMTYIELKDMDGDNIPELHFTTAMGKSGFLYKTKIFYYVNGELATTEGNYGGVSSYPPRLFANKELGERAWIIGEYEVGSDIYSILYHGINAKRVDFVEGELQTENIIKVEGSQYSGRVPTEGTAFGREYTDLNDLKRDIDEMWKWEEMETTGSTLYLWPGENSGYSRTDLEQFINSYGRK